MPAPSLPLPPPLTGANQGTWAHSTIVVRLPDIAGRVLEENDLPSDQAEAVRQLIAEIPDTPIRPLRDRAAPDFDDWQSYCHPYLGGGWLAVPWLFVETYFYRRILEAVDYFARQEGSRDPFALQKQRALAQMGDLVSQFERGSGSTAQALDLALWGNQSDLSLWPAGEDAGPASGQSEERSNYLLHDDLDRVLDYLNAIEETGPGFDIILDNVGVELAADLILTHHLIGRWEGSQVTVHAKAHPTFVSDATSEDVLRAISILQKSDTSSAASLGDNLKRAFDNGRLQLNDHSFWTSPLPLWQMPSELYDQFGNRNLLILKGDANYRRAVGDLHWPYNTPVDEVMSYAPSPMLALRTLKSEVACGIKVKQAERAAQRDPDWMTNGKWAVRQLYLSG